MMYQSRVVSIHCGLRVTGAGARAGAGAGAGAGARAGARAKRTRVNGPVADFEELSKRTNECYPTTTRKNYKAFRR